MATKKLNLREQYAKIVAEQGEKLENCTVLAFVFPTEGKAKTFHYALLSAEPRVPYLVYDYTAVRTQVVVKKNEAVEGRLQIMAEIHKGKRVSASY